MVYDNSKVRRQDRLLDEAGATELLSNGEYGVLSMQAESGGGYGVPVNYVWDGAGCIYIHCAPEGRKLRCIEACDEVSFCVVGATQVIPDKFTTAYRSIVLSCRACANLDEQERWRALRLLIAKYSADYKEIGEKYAERSFHRTRIIRLDVKEWSGKTKRML